MRTLPAVILSICAVSSAAAQTHVMSGPVDPFSVPKWEDVFADGPFDLPDVKSRTDQPPLPVTAATEEAMHACRLGFAAFARWDDREAERAFRLAIERDASCALGCAGLALANMDALPGKGSVFAARAVEKATPVLAAWEKGLIDALGEFFRDVRGPLEPRRQALAARIETLSAGDPGLSAVRAVLPRLRGAKPDFSAVPANPGALLHAARALGQLNRHAEAARWAAAAVRAAEARHPADMEEWRLAETAEAFRMESLASAGDVASVRQLATARPAAALRAFVRLAAWDDVLALPLFPEKAPLRDRADQFHGRALAGFTLRKPELAFPELARLQILIASARKPTAGTPPETLQALENLESELQVHNLLARGANDVAADRLRALRGVPPERLVALEHELGRAVLVPSPRPVAGDTQPPPVPAPPAAGPLTPWSLPDAAGTPHAFPAVLTKPTVFIFFLGRHCRHCMDQLNTFAPFHARIQSAGAQLIAISQDGVDGVAQTFVTPAEAKKPFPFLILADPDLAAFKAWGVMDQFEGDPIHATFIVDVHGTLRWRHLGAEPFMMVADVLEALEALPAPAKAK